MVGAATEYQPRQVAKELAIYQKTRKSKINYAAKAT